MGEKNLQPGEFVYREGDSADTAYIVVSGKVELLTVTDGLEVKLGTAEAGQVFGELAVFDPQAQRPQHARVVEAAVLTTVSPEEFQADLAQAPKRSLPILQLAADKMRATRVKSKQSAVDTVLEGDIAKVVVSPASDKLKSQFKPIEVPLVRLPYRIGGYPEGGEVSRRDQVHLSIASQDNPLRVSRQHCEIAIENKAIVVTDLGSRFCTRVNDVVLGRGRGHFSAPLKKGDNEVTLGMASDSPYKLIITCE